MTHQFDGFILKIPAAEEGSYIFDDMTQDRGYDPLDNSTLFAELILDPWASLDSFPAVYLKTEKMDEHEVEVHKAGKDPVVVSLNQGHRPGFNAS